MVLYEAYKETGRQEEAQGVYAHLSTLIQPAIVAYNEGKTAIETGDFDSAKAKFAEAVDLDPELAASHEALAWIYLNQGCVIPMMVVPSLVGIMLGSFIGVRILRVAKPAFVRWIVIVLLLFAGAKALTKGLGLPFIV